MSPPLSLILTTGAGQPQAAPWMAGWRARLAALGPVRAIDWPYLAAGRKRPDPQRVLVAALRREVEETVADGASGVALIGKSMGGRMGCHLAAEDAGKLPIRALVCLSYPLIGANGDRREDVLLALRTPVLFVQGTRDPKAALADLEAVRARMAAPTALHVVETGDHSLLVRKRHPRTQEEEDAAALAAIRAFLAALPPPPAPEPP